MGNFHLKADIPSFNRDLNIKNFLNWLSNCDQLMEYLDISDEKMARLLNDRFRLVEQNYLSETEEQ